MHQPDPAGLYADHLATVMERTRTALAAGGYERLLVYAGRAPLRFLDDREYPYTANPHFKWWVPLLSHPDCWIAYRPGERPVLLYHQPVDFWYLPPADPSGYWTDGFDIRVIRNPGEARPLLQGAGRTAVLGELPDDIAAWGLGDVNPAPVIASLHYDRAAKTPYELACMRQASRLGAAGHRAAERAFREGASEYEIHLAYCRATGHTDLDLPYDNIIAINAHGAVLHYQGRDRDPVPRDGRRSLLIDAGASFAGYACDITRTFSYRDDEFADLIAAMDAMQQRLCGEVRAKLDYPSLHFAAHHELAAVLVEANLVTCSPESAVEQGITRVFFPHGLGHYLGLQVHDVGGFQADRSGTVIPRPEKDPFLRLTRRIEADHVMTIEPGLYFIEPLLAPLRESAAGRDVDWARVDAFRPCGGIRVEDNVRALEGGHENLTREAFAAA